MALVETKAVGPEMAAILLEGNTRNRPAKQQHIDNLAREMSEGRFQYNGDTIRVDRHGNLLDGQHRLMAVVKSGTTHLMTIISGLDPETFLTIDQGTRRTSADMLGVANPELKNIGHMASASRLLALMESKKIDSAKRGSTIRNDQVIVTCAANEKLLHEGLCYGFKPHLRKLIPAAQSAAVFAHFSKENRLLTVEFFAAMCEPMPTLEIASLLRNQFTDNKIGVKRMPNTKLICLFMKAMRKHLDGQKVRQLKLTVNEPPCYANY